MEEKPKNSINNIIKLTIFFIVVILIAIVFARYLINDEFRSNVDTKIFRKELTENTSNIIEINSDGKPEIYAFDKYITVLSKDVLTFYDETSNIVSKLDVDITKPYMASNEKYLAVAENGGSKLYLISSTEMKWEKDIDGEIYRVSINKNGFITVLLKNTTYKSIVVVYDLEGKELFRTYLATNYAIASEISNSNKYLAIGEIDYSGTVVKSIVEMIDIDLVKDNPQDSVIYAYESESGRILTNIKFNTENEAICMFDTYIQKVTALSDERLYDITDDNIFVDINLENNIIDVGKETSGLFSYEYQINFKNTVGKSDNLYILENDLPKKIKVTNNLVCVNLLNEVRIINSSGWLLKRYTTNSEIQDIVVGNNIIGIVYNNKIEIINI